MKRRQEGLDVKNVLMGVLGALTAFGGAVMVSLGASASPVKTSLEVGGSLVAAMGVFFVVLAFPGRRR